MPGFGAQLPHDAKGLEPVISPSSRETVMASDPRSLAFLWVNQCLEIRLPIREFGRQKRESTMLGETTRLPRLRGSTRRSPARKV
jgi:hypothetical protein